MAGSIADDPFVDHGVQVQIKYEWTEKEDAGRWSRPQQGIKKQRYSIPSDPNNPNNDGHGIRVTKLKARGHGRSMVLRFESEEGKDFQIAGWAVPISVETTP